jgi:DNA-nicking Smr family endonuclease
LSTKRADPDATLFREAMRDVKPIARHQRALPEKPKPPARAAFTAADRKRVLVESLDGFGESDITDSGDEIAFRRDGVQSGEYRVEAVCDLHGLRVEEAKHALREFLAESLARNLRCVRVIHGKGHGSGPRGPVIKTAVNMILRKTGPVLAFTSARRIDGGTGAINVLLS